MITNIQALEYFKMRREMRLDDKVQEYENLAIKALANQISSFDSSELTRRLVAERDKENLAICLIEEMSELTKVLTKDLRASDKFKKEQLEEELGHVLLMCEAIKNKYDIDNSKILYHKLDALKRCFTIYTNSFDIEEDIK
jgi:NTP pyrophosphatase (non-canonical NTP hydrolase)